MPFPHLNEYEFRFHYKNDVYITKKVKALHIGVAWYLIAMKISKGLPRLLSVEYIKRIN